MSFSNYKFIRIHQNFSFSPLVKLVIFQGFGSHGQLVGDVLDGMDLLDSQDA